MTVGGFSGPYQLQNWQAIASNGGTTTITPSSGASLTGEFAYSIDLGTGGVTPRTWTFQTAAAGKGTVSFDFEYTGFHGFYNVTALLQAFSAEPGGATVTLYNPPQQDCCTTPSAGFSVKGTATLHVTQGYRFGFIVGGHNYDSNAVLQGTLPSGRARTARWRGAPRSSDAGDLTQAPKVRRVS